MNLAELERKLIAAARANSPSERVPYAFEKRILALIASRPALDHLGAVGPRFVARCRALRRDHASVGSVVVVHAAAQRPDERFVPAA